jgi:CRISPR-associated endoribonuclease Cas6
VRAGEPFWLRFTLLNSELFATFTRYLLAPPARPGRSGQPRLRLDELDFAITEMLTTPGSHPWAGYTTAAELCRQWHTTALEKAHYKISLELASGTVFSPSGNKAGMGKFMEVLPTPEMLFGSLAAAWNERIGLALDHQAIRAYAQETVVVSNYKLETQLFHYWGQPQVGAVGRVTYQLKDSHTPELAAALNLLADFAFYSGLGAKTAMGMGMARRGGED